MFLIKILMWLSIYFIFYILFSSNTLISIFCFILVIFFICVLLLQLHIEYLTFLILLLYLGGILIFFLFTALMLNNEYTSSKISFNFSFENIFILLIFFKAFLAVTLVNNSVSLQKYLTISSYFPNLIGNNYFLNDLFNNQGDTLTFLSLFSEKYILLFILGNLLLFTMMGVIVITKK